jgi:hypothetical protein
MRPISCRSVLLPVVLAALAACDGANPFGAAGVTPPVNQLSIVGADTQSVAVGAAASRPLAVRVTSRSGAGVQGIAVTFAVLSGGGTLSATSATTDAGGNASATYTAGLTSGPATVGASSPGLGSRTFNLTVTGP